MGRSCFNIISCGCINQSKDIDEINISSQNKGPDKPGWSLRKKSPRHEAPSNTVVNEKISSIDTKEIPEPITISPEPHINSNVAEKTSDDILTKEIPNSATKPVCIEDDTKHERAPEKSKSESEYESAALVIQAAIRRFLAERQLIKHKNVVKLQAAVRGHLVRNHAVGTLRCVQAIVKMQALVRARREKGVQNTGIINSNPAHVSIEKLLSNRLARQLLESTPKTKQINIKCDPLKSDSAWNWLERWMSVSSPETLQPHTPDHDQDKVVNNAEEEVKTVISKPVPENKVSDTESNLIPENPVSETEPEPIPENPVSETKTEPEPIPENPVSKTEPEPEPEHEPISENPVSETVPEPIAEISVSETKPEPIPENPVTETEPEPIPENPVTKTVPEPIPEISVSETEPEPIPENAVSETEPEPIPENAVSETEPKQTAKRTGSIKASNPAFIAAQSKFEELTSSLTNPFKSLGSSKQDDEPGCGSVEPRDDLVNHGSRVVKTGGSECGTELSITSTLDSPFEIENTKFEEADTSINYDNNNNNSNSSSDNNNNNNNNNNNIGVVTPEKQVDQKPNNIEPEPESSHITNLESQGTPSSQLSTTSKKTRTDKKVSSQTRKSWSTSKKSSPVSSSVDSGLRTSLEHLPKESKPGKRRNVFGSPKRDHVDGELVVPGYMQVTESARAKAVANISPRSSPDFKKRHSLPGTVNDRHGSPRIRRSPSQALQATKGNGNQERKWQI